MEVFFYMGKVNKVIINTENSSGMPLYIQLYNHYKSLISSGSLKSGSKLPSIRRCASERMISRTTVEAAYLQLAAEGYIISRAGSGFYVSDLNYTDIQIPSLLNYTKSKVKEEPLYDFVSSTVDHKVLTLIYGADILRVHFEVGIGFYLMVMLKESMILEWL